MRKYLVVAMLAAAAGLGAAIVPMASSATVTVAEDDPSFGPDPFPPRKPPELPIERPKKPPIQEPPVVCCD